MISLAEAWAKPEDRDFLETGIRRAAGALKLRDMMPEPLEEYQKDPVGFCVDILGVPEHTIRWSLNPGYENHAWDGTPDPIAELLEALARWENPGVESGTGTGKSFALGMAYLYFLGCFEDSRVFTFAPKEDQLRLYSWMEIRKHFWSRFKKHFPMAQLTDLRIRMIPGSDQWGAWGYPVQVRAGEEVAQAAKGQHAEHMLHVYEEMPGIDSAVEEAGSHTATAPHNLRAGVGNPEHQHDALHLFCQKPGVTHIRISALDHPNVVVNHARDPEWKDLKGDVQVIPGACSRISVNRQRLEHGEDSRMFKAQVRGISPEEAAEALIKAIWVREAFARYEDTERRLELEAQGFAALAADVAQSENGDKAAIARGHGAVLHGVQAFPVGEGHPVRDSNVLGRNIAVEAALSGIPERHIGVDPVGVGAGTVNELRAHGLNVPSLNGGEKPRPMIDEDLFREKDKALMPEELFYNLRAQMHWQMRQDLLHGRIAIAPDEELLRDLTTPMWETRNGKILVQAKEKIREEIGRSPNKGDAAIYWNFVRFRREMEPDDEPIRAWDEDVLVHEAREGRRVKSKPPARDTTLDPAAVEWIP